MADLDTLLARLAEAEGALHQLSLGKKSAAVSYEGKSNTFTQANINDLRAYITDLKNQIAALTGAPRPRRAIGVRFR